MTAVIVLLTFILIVSIIGVIGVVGAIASVSTSLETIAGCNVAYMIGSLEDEDA